LLILVALGLAVFGTIRATRELEPQQRVVAWLVLIVAVVLLFVKLVDGPLGSRHRRRILKDLRACHGARDLHG